jgi:DNA-binding SARP family transcriptional activator
MNLHATQDTTEFEGQPGAPPGRPGRRFLAEVYEHFPHAVMVVAASRQIISANRRARLILDRGDPGGEVETCCRLLGCRRPGGPLARFCITELALQTGERLPELRLDVPAAPTGALWVTAAPLAGEAVVFELRPGSVRDRRARRRPQWLDGPQLRVFALGNLRVESREGPITGDWLHQPPGQLLGFLVSERHRVAPVDEIAGAVWGETGRGAMSRVRHLVDTLRDQLEPERPARDGSSFVLARRGGYALNGERVWIDVDEFEQEVRGGVVAIQDDDREEAILRLERAAKLYQDDFLADEPSATWALEERERLRDPAEDMLRSLATLHEDEPFKSASYLERLGRMEPFDNEVHRALIATLLKLGRRNRAARHYLAFRRRLETTFGHGPDFDLSELPPAP